VLVFVHGGGFTAGASTHSMYDGSALARHGDVLVVSFNYRLGALGYADVGALGGELTADTNCGLRDQLAALRFVREHIADFGGDPERITLMGHSAGAMSVCTLLTSPQAQGLFGRAIAQSGAGHHVSSRAESARIAERLVEALGLGPHELPKLRELPFEAIVKAQSACLRQWSLVGPASKPLHNANMTLVPVVDGTLVPEVPVEAAAGGAGGEVPLLLGTTRQEHNFWLFLSDPQKRDLDEAGLSRVVEKRLPGRASEAIELYRRPGAPFQIFSAIETDRVFGIPARRLAEARARAASAPTYLYELDWTGPLFEGALGACHTMDVPFTLGMVDDGFGKVFTGGGAEARRLSLQVMDAWLAFARGGDPSTASLGEWPRVRAEARPRMQLAREPQLSEVPADSIDAFWRGLL
jgi:para-nitrobenzyl esterase